jgi:hypothetical protein
MDISPDPMDSRGPTRSADMASNNPPHPGPPEIDPLPDNTPGAETPGATLAVSNLGAASSGSGFEAEASGNLLLAAGLADFRQPNSPTLAALSLADELLAADSSDADSDGAGAAEAGNSEPASPSDGADAGEESNPEPPSSQTDPSDADAPEEDASDEDDGPNADPPPNNGPDIFPPNKPPNNPQALDLQHPATRDLHDIQIRLREQRARTLSVSARLREIGGEIEVWRQDHPLENLTATLRDDITRFTAAVEVAEEQARETRLLIHDAIDQVEAFMQDFEGLLGDLELGLAEE